MGLQNLFVDKKILSKRDRLTYAEIKCYRGLIKCSREKKARPRRATKIDLKGKEWLLKNSVSRQLYGPLSRSLAWNKIESLSDQQHIVSRKTISNRSSPNPHVISNTILLDCTLESCKLSNCHLVGCLVTNCKAVDSEFSNSLISWHHLEKYEEWLFENCKFSDCLLENALVKNSELHRSSIELASTYISLKSMGDPKWYIRRSYLQGCTFHACKFSRAIVADSQLLDGCELDFVTIARCNVGHATVRQSTFVESTAIYCRFFEATMQKCTHFENNYNECEVGQSVSLLHRLPPEIRLVIFQYSIDDPSCPVFLRTYYPELTNLIAAVRGDQELYREVLEVRDRHINFEYRAVFQDNLYGCSWDNDPLPQKAWRSLQRLTLQFALQRNIAQITIGSPPPEIELIRRPIALKFLSLELQDFIWVRGGLWETLSCLSSLASLTQMSIMFYPRIRDIRMSTSFASGKGRHFERVERWLRGRFSIYGPLVTPPQVREVLPALDKFFGVKSYTDGPPGDLGCKWVWQAKKGDTLKIEQTLDYFAS